MPDPVDALIVAAEWVGSQVGGEVVASWVISAAEVAAVVGSVAIVSSMQAAAKKRAIDAYNASLRDRYVSRRGSTEPRQIVLGRCRVSGPWAFWASYGANRDHFVVVVALADHPCDGIEQVMFGDEPVELDGSGNVTGLIRTNLFAITGATGSFTLTDAPRGGAIISAEAHYGTTVVTLGATVTGSTVAVTGGHVAETGQCIIKFVPDPCPFVVSKSARAGSATYSLPVGGTSSTQTLPETPDAGSVIAVETTGTGETRVDIPLAFTLSGTTITFTSAGFQDLAQAVVTYTVTQAVSRARVRWHLGSSSQAADSDLISEIPALWTSAHRLRGTTYLVCEFDYDETALATGIPNPSAIVRGALCYDPRSGSTAWSENPALCTRYYLKSPIGGRRSDAQINDAELSVAANICDTNATYVVGGKNYARKLFTCGYMAQSTTKPADALNDLVLAMAGDWCEVDDQIVLKAGAVRTPVSLAIDRTWLSTHAPQQFSPRPAREALANVYIGTFADETQAYQVVDYPQVPQDPTTDAMVIEDGEQLPRPLSFAAVTFSGQAQYIAACLRRLERQPLYTFGAKMQAFPLTPFDVLPVTEPTFGLAADAYEVLSTSWTPPAGFVLNLRKADSTIWDMDSGGYTLPSLPPPSRLISPLDLPAVAGLAVAAVAQRQADGSVAAGLQVTMTAQTQPRIALDGQIQITWGRIGDAESTWQSQIVPGNATQVVVGPVNNGVKYAVKARTVGTLATGPWSAMTSTLVGLSNSYMGLIGTPQLANQAATKIQTASVAGPTYVIYSGSDIGSITYGPFTDDAEIEFTVSLSFDLAGNSGIASGAAQIFSGIGTNSSPMMKVPAVYSGATDSCGLTLSYHDHYTGGSGAMTAFVRVFGSSLLPTIGHPVTNYKDFEFRVTAVLR